ncbi:MAG: OFA family MFS transporter [Pirellulales bacterium]|nr:OFA family MFS transporter [Pirellulales bacterium]
MDGGRGNLEGNATPRETAKSSESGSILAPIKNLGWQVTFAGLGINLALGVLYSWSVISKEIPAGWKWTEAQKSWPYSIACLVFALMMVPAGRLQDKVGPRLVATFGGILVGIGLIIASMTTSYGGYVLAFGLLAGTGIGFGYASATPPAVKWFPAAKTGLIAGLVVAGFGLASVYIAPLTKMLITDIGVEKTMLSLGIAFLIIVTILAQFLVAPPKGYVPAGSIPAKGSAASVKREDFSPFEMLRHLQFYLLWFMYACGAGAGLMIIAKLAKIAESQAGVKLGFALVAMLAVGNGGGRILAGMASDKIGRKPTLVICFLMQALLMAILTAAQKDTLLASVPAMALISALIGANYGANLSLFPSITKDFYGLKNFGVNYGLVFTAWGVGGFLLSLLAGFLYDRYATFTYSCHVAAGLLVLAAIVTFMVQPPHAAGQKVKP